MSLINIFDLSNTQIFVNIPLRLQTRTTITKNLYCHKLNFSLLMFKSLEEIPDIYGALQVRIKDC